MTLMASKVIFIVSLISSAVSSRDMAEELGREATVEELARRMELTADEIRDSMKMTLDAMSVMGE